MVHSLSADRYVMPRYRVLDHIRVHVCIPVRVHFLVCVRVRGRVLLVSGMGVFQRGAPRTHL